MKIISNSMNTRLAYKGYSRIIALEVDMSFDIEEDLSVDGPEKWKRVEFINSIYEEIKQKIKDKNFETSGNK